MMEEKKVMVTGFPHCGTTILQSIISHSNDVYNFTKETAIFTKEFIDRCRSSKKKIALIKYPFFNLKYISEGKNDFVVFIIRNPLFVFSSLNKRFNFKIPKNHDIERYIDTYKSWLKLKKEKCRKTRHICIKYEELFIDDYKVIKNIFKELDITFEDKLLDNKLYKNCSNLNGNIPLKEPRRIYHDQFRSWQINQNLQNFNDVSSLYLTQTQIDTFKNYSKLLEIEYPDIERMLLELEMKNSVLKNSKR